MYTACVIDCCGSKCCVGTSESFAAFEDNSARPTDLPTFEGITLCGPKSAKEFVLQHVFANCMSADAHSGDSRWTTITFVVG